MDQVTIADVYRARQVVGRYLAPTPLLAAPRLSRRTGCEVCVKYENMSPIRSFKARGAIICVSRLAPGQGVACASTGNHGQGIALAAGLFGRRAVVVVPRSTPEQKQVAMRHFGADLRVRGRGPGRVGRDRDAARRGGEPGLRRGRREPRRDGRLRHPRAGDCRATARRRATARPRRRWEPDRRLRPGRQDPAAETVLVGVQSDAAPAVYDSWLAGQSVRLERCDTFAGGLATSYPCSFTFPYIQRYVDEMVLVPGRRPDRCGARDAGRDGTPPRGRGRCRSRRAPRRTRALRRRQGRDRADRRQLRAGHLGAIGQRRMG